MSLTKALEVLINDGGDILRGLVELKFEELANKPEFKRQGDPECTHPSFKEKFYRNNVCIGGVCSRCGKAVRF